MNDIIHLTPEPEDAPAALQRALQEDAGWRRYWDLPRDREHLLAVLAAIGMTVEDFKRTDMYTHNVAELPWLKHI